MKREIKFRAKRIDNGKWVYGGITSPMHEKENLVKIVSIENYEDDEDENIFIEVDIESVGQFTGLKDKNRVEIYEGDILKTECGDIVEVEFDHIYCSFGIIKNGWAFFHYFHEAVEAKDCEVIGNIHDNPELLK